jgi:hypothetical protein
MDLADLLRRHLNTRGTIERVAVQKGVRFKLRIVFNEYFVGADTVSVFYTLAPEPSQEDERQISLERSFRLGESPETLSEIPENLSLFAPEGIGPGFSSKDWDIASEEQREWFRAQWRMLLTETP